MPELPDVEAFRSVLDTCARGRRIQQVDVRDTGVLHGVSARRLQQALEGHHLTRAERSGKWLLAHTDNGPVLMLHFGMTGQLLCCHPRDAPHPHDRVTLTVRGDRQLRYRDQRKLKGLWLAADRAAVAGTTGPQGPDALAADRKEFCRALAGRRGGVKSALLDQSVLAGLGNLLADEALWRAKLHPARLTGDLDDDEFGRLWRGMRRTLRSSVAVGRVPPRRTWLTGRRNDTDARCPRCGERLRDGRIAGRHTIWCPRCQPADS